MNVEKMLQGIFMPPTHAIWQGMPAEVGIAVPFSVSYSGGKPYLPSQGMAIVRSLAHVFHAGVIRRTFVSGGYPNINGQKLDTLVEADLAWRDLEGFGVPPSKIWGEWTSKDTEENALHIVPAIRELNLRPQSTIVIFVNTIQSGRAWRVYDRVFRREGLDVVVKAWPVVNDNGIWDDNHKKTLRNQYVFMLRELVARKLFWFKGY